MNIKYWLITFIALVLISQFNTVSAARYRLIENGVKQEQPVFKLLQKEEKKKTRKWLISVPESKEENDISNTHIQESIQINRQEKIEEEINEKVGVKKRKTIPMIPQLSAPPIGREVRDEVFFARIIEENLAEVDYMKNEINGVNFYTLLEEKLWEEYRADVLDDEAFRSFSLHTRLRFANMYNIFQFAFYNVREYENIIQKASKDFNVSPYIIKAIIVQESQGKNTVSSWKGAKGLMQLMDTTGDMFGVQNPYDPTENIRAGTRHFKGMMTLFNNNIELAVAAYNAGGGAVQRFGGIPPYPETQNYVLRVQDYMKLYAQKG